MGNLTEEIAALWAKTAALPNHGELLWADWKRLAELERERADAAEALAASALAALDGGLRRCNRCGALALWEWSDYDCTEFVCDEHKTEHSYEYGPIELDGARPAIELFANPDAALLLARSRADAAVVAATVEMESLYAEPRPLSTRERVEASEKLRLALAARRTLDNSAQ